MCAGRKGERGKADEGGRARERNGSGACVQAGLTGMSVCGTEAL